MKKYRIVYWLAAVCCLPLFTAWNRPCGCVPYAVGRISQCGGVSV